MKAVGVCEVFEKALVGAYKYTSVAGCQQAGYGVAPQFGTYDSSDGRPLFVEYVQPFLCAYPYSVQLVFGQAGDVVVCEYFPAAYV